MNVKTAAAKLNYDPSLVYLRLRKFGFSPRDITDEQLEVIKSLPSKKGVDRRLADKYHIDLRTVRSLASQLGLSVNDPKMGKAIELKLSREYTILGIKKRL